MPKCTSISIQAQARNRVESCSCNLFSNNSLSMVFPTTGTTTHDSAFDEPITSFSAVDCTLSLGTPSTRQTSCNNGDVNKKPKSGNNNNSFMSNLCWSAFQTTKKTTNSPSAPLPPTTVGCINNNTISNGDPLLARRCANCDTTSTPLWRNGPRGPKSLCNACGIRYKKEERRATTPHTNSGGAAAPQPPPHLMSHPAAWTHHHPGPSQKVLGNEFRFMEAAAAGDTTNNFLSWRLNIPDHRASLVNDYTY